MTATIGWIETSPAALRRLRQVLAGESEGVRDEIGVGALHAGYADRFFPGTSVLQRRPRYLFFTAWNYLVLDRITDYDSALDRKERAEEWVCRQLKRAQQREIIGQNVRRPVQSVDFIHWTALRSWGFYKGVSRTTLIERWEKVAPRRVKLVADTDDVVDLEASAQFSVPADPPNNWLRTDPRDGLEFNLTKGEASFLSARLISLDECLLAECARQARTSVASGSAIWNDNLVLNAARLRDELPVVQRARQASTLAHVIRAVYAALVEKQRNLRANQSSVPAADRYFFRGALEKLLDTRACRDVVELSEDGLKLDIPQIDPGFLRLVGEVRQAVAKLQRGASVDRALLNDKMYEVFERIEVKRKGPARARLSATPRGIELQSQFDRRSVTLAGIDYRWQSVRSLLRDLQEGMAS